MKIFRLSDDLSFPQIYPQKRQYFTIYFMGYQIDLDTFTNAMGQHIPEDWPVVIISGEIKSLLNPEHLKQIRYAASISQAAVMWNAADCDMDMSLNPIAWSSQIGRFVSSNKGCFLGASIKNPYYLAASVAGYDDWYVSLPRLCYDLSVLIKSNLLEAVTITSNIAVKNGVR